MDINTLNTRISKKQDEIEKINRRITKWSKGLPTEFIPQVKETTKMNYVLAGKALKEIAEKTNLSYWDLEELRRTYMDLDEAKVTLEKYKNLLKVEEVKNNKLSEERIKVIWDFLLQWKEKAKQYYERQLKILLDYYALNKETCELHNNSTYFKRTHTPEEYEQYVANMKEKEKEEKRLREIIDPVTYKVYDSRTKGLDYNKLNDLLDKEMENKYISMVDKVTEITGEITDATDLRIDPRGEINGYIKGVNGTAKIKKVSWNVNMRNLALDNSSIKTNSNNTVTITIEYIGDSSNKDSFDSFAIVNYNPQKR